MTAGRARQDRRWVEQPPGSVLHAVVSLGHGTGAGQNSDVVEGIGLNTMCLSASRVSVIFQLHARHCPLPLLPPAQHGSPPHWLVSLAASGKTAHALYTPCKLQCLGYRAVPGRVDIGYSFRHGFATALPSADPCHHMRLPALHCSRVPDAQVSKHIFGRTGLR